MPELRASDSDRERAAADLRDHYAAGRLSSAELSERLDAAYAATTVSALAELRADLPDPRPLPAVPAPRDLARRRVMQDAGAVVILDIGCVVVWAATGANGSFWPMWVILVSAFRLARDAWRLLGPAGEPSAAHVRRHGRSRGPWR
ncbi:MAG TPA: DUF1707 domain-containing protein [Solirubrobacteraceae bacterium]|nr:DUF1707 domain-containing protein [Solirubrobacteraceae bacterium]